MELAKGDEIGVAVRDIYDVIQFDRYLIYKWYSYVSNFFSPEHLAFGGGKVERFVL